jgi:hypothetical protein
MCRMLAALQLLKAFLHSLKLGRPTQPLAASSNGQSADDAKANSMCRLQGLNRRDPKPSLRL